MKSLDRAIESLEGLSVGDAFGQCFFQTGDSTEALIQARTLPPAPWYYTDDTEMSLSIVAVLARHRTIDQDQLAHSFAAHYHYDRAYGPSMHRKLERIRNGEAWREVAAGGFGGQGSYGNGAAMRVAPLGVYFCDDPLVIEHQAALSAAVTHAHPEGIAGAVAVALAAGEAFRCRGQSRRPSHGDFLEAIVSRLPHSEVRSKLVRAQAMESVQSLQFPVAVLGNGTDMSAQDTVPFALWCCAQSLDNYSNALWLAVAALGDRDTICAIVGGVVSCYTGAAGIPPEWRVLREALPTWHLNA